MNQPASKSSKQPKLEGGATSDEAAELAAQLDALLAQEAGADADLDEISDTAAEPAASAESPTADAPTPESDSDDALADQIQSLLDEAEALGDFETVDEVEAAEQSQPAADAASSDPVAQQAAPKQTVAEQATPEQPVPEQATPAQTAAEVEAAPDTAPETSPRTAQAAEAEPQAGAPPEAATEDTGETDAGTDDADDDTDDAVLIEQIDRMLADQAEHSLGDMQSVEQVLAEDDATRQENSRQSPAEPPVADKTDHTAANADDEAADLDGVFETPEQLLTDASAADEASTSADAESAGHEVDDDWDESDEVDEDEGASASDVAAELDDQPEHHRAPGPSDAPSMAVSKATDKSSPWGRRLARVERAARYTCALVNRPLDYLNEENRKLVGYAAILFAGINFLLVFALGLLT